MLHLLPMIVLAWLPWFVLGIGGLALGFRAVRAFERRSLPSPEISSLRERLQQLEDVVSEQGEELRRVTEGQRFAESLLADRSGGDAGPSGRSTPQEGGMIGS
jgi:hypothetical protein